MSLENVIEAMHRAGLIYESLEVRTVYARLQSFALQLDKECFDTVLNANHVLAAQNKALN